MPRSSKYRPPLQQPMSRFTQRIFNLLWFFLIIVSVSARRTDRSTDQQSDASPISPVLLNCLNAINENKGETLECLVHLWEYHKDSLPDEENRKIQKKYLEIQKKEPRESLISNVPLMQFALKRKNKFVMGQMLGQGYDMLMGESIIDLPAYDAFTNYEFPFFEMFLMQEFNTTNGRIDYTPSFLQGLEGHLDNALYYQDYNFILQLRHSNYSKAFLTSLQEYPGGKEIINRFNAMVEDKFFMRSFPFFSWGERVRRDPFLYLSSAPLLFFLLRIIYLRRSKRKIYADPIHQKVMDKKRAREDANGLLRNLISRFYRKLIKKPIAHGELKSEETIPYVPSFVNTSQAKRKSLPPKKLGSKTPAPKTTASKPPAPQSHSHHAATDASAANVRAYYTKLNDQKGHGWGRSDLNPPLREESPPPPVEKSDSSITIEASIPSESVLEVSISKPLVNVRPSEACASSSATSEPVQEVSVSKPTIKVQPSDVSTAAPLVSKAPVKTPFLTYILQTNELPKEALVFLKNMNAKDPEARTYLVGGILRDAMIRQNQNSGMKTLVEDPENLVEIDAVTNSRKVQNIIPSATPSHFVENLMVGYIVNRPLDIFFSDILDSVDDLYDALKADADTRPFTLEKLYGRYIKNAEGEYIELIAPDPQTFKDIALKVVRTSEPAEVAVTQGIHVLRALKHSVNLGFEIDIKLSHFLKSAAAKELLLQMCPNKLNAFMRNIKKSATPISMWVKIEEYGLNQIIFNKLKHDPEAVTLLRSLKEGLTALVDYSRQNKRQSSHQFWKQKSNEVAPVVKLSNVEKGANRCTTTRFN